MTDEREPIDWIGSKLVEGLVDSVEDGVVEEVLLELIRTWDLGFVVGQKVDEGFDGDDKKGVWGWFGWKIC